LEDSNTNAALGTLSGHPACLLCVVKPTLPKLFGVPLIGSFTQYGHLITISSLDKTRLALPQADYGSTVIAT
jgi:hypothetical protein